MFILKNAAGAVVKMKNGQPFVYSSRDLARTAKKLLEGEHKTTLTVVSA